VRQLRIAANALKSCNKVRLVLVQLRSPFSDEDGKNEELAIDFGYGRKAIRWTNSEHVEKRKQDFRAILDEIKAECFKDSEVRIVVFPEYAVPSACYDGLQSFADDHNCILIPGSHYQTEQTQPLKNNNVCTIFLPRQQPVTIVKKNGWRAEAEVIETDPAMPNIVHLSGDNDILGPFSISVAICRDYLMPFSDVSEDGSTCLLDFTKPGINIVVMCSSQVRLFEARAAFDIRDLPGPRRITALCNCAGLGVEGTVTFGSAILGPQEHAEDPEERAESAWNDVVTSLPGDQEGIVQADIVLNIPQLALIEIKPDRKTVAPVRHALSYTFSNRPLGRGKPSIPLAQRQNWGPLERGVWHPAFLEQLQLCMVLHLFRTRQVDLLEDAIRNHKIRNVSAFAIEGKQDALFYYYRSTAAGDSDFRLKNCLTLGETDYEKIFMGEGHSIVVRPEDIIKYRSIRVPPKQQNDGWQAERRKIAQLVPKQLNRERRLRLKHITQLARDWNTQGVLPTDRDALSDIFFDQREYVSTASAYVMGRNNIREKFVLISDGGKTGSDKKAFELQIINDKLAPLPEVRSIYKIDTELDDAHFNYWVDVVGEPWKIAEIVLGISTWGNRLGLDTGTRTMEVLKFYSTESVTGVYATDLPTEVREFLDEAKQRGAYVAKPPASQVIIDAYELLIACGTGWYQQTSSVDGPEAQSIVENVSTFYVNLFFGNIVAEAKVQRKHYEAAADAWLRIFKKLETLFDTILKKHFGTSNADAARELTKERLEELGPLRDADKNVLKTNSIQGVFRLAKYDDTVPFRNAADFDRLPSIYEDVRAFRNKLTHGEEKVHQLLTVHAPEDPKHSKDDLRKVTIVTAQLLELVNACYEIIDSI
jgi:hypothetical protein